VSTKIGDPQSQWESKSIESLAEPKGIAYGVLKPGPNTPNGIPMIRVTDIQEGRIDPSAIYRIGTELDREFRRTRLTGGEVVVSIQGSVGRVAVVPDALAGANVSRTLAMIRLSDPSLNFWVQMALESPQTQQAMKMVTGGTTRDRLNLRDLRKIEILLPPHDERLRLMALLESVAGLNASSNSRIAKAHRAIQVLRLSILDAACSGKLTESWRESHKCTVHPDLTSRPELGGNDARGVPDTWSVVEVGDIGKVQLGGTPSRKNLSYWNGSVPWVSSGEVANCRLSTTRETISASGMANSSAKLYPVGTVLIAMIGEGKTRGSISDPRY
jgi:type I restriction enzyme, S subunit